MHSSRADREARRGDVDAELETTASDPPTPRQPWLHDLDITVLGTVTCVAGVDGDLGEQPASGLFVDDRRVVRDLRLRYDGRAAIHLTSYAAGRRASSYLVARELGPAGPDPTVTIRRTRTLRGLGMEERLVVTSSALGPVTTTLTVDVAGDGLDLASVKGGASSHGLLPASITGDHAAWADDVHRTRVTAPGALLTPLPTGGLRLRWDVRVAPGAPTEISFATETTRLGPTPFDAGSGADSVDWAAFDVRAGDGRLDRTVATSVEDLVGLLQTDPLDHDDVFLGAGSPWYLTLFGRDSIWASRFALPLGTDLAGGTLRSLARRQGTRVDPSTAEEPGKIVHEVRRPDSDPRAPAHRLPPVYYGTVDATPLWILLLHDAWRWGLPDHVVDDMSGNLRRAVDWLRASADASVDGFLRYNDPTGRGLSNQGWKDSHDAMRRRDGGIGDAPIALLEVQAYAVQAARAAADLHERLLGESGDELRTWADDLSDRVRQHFWVADAEGRYLAMALDRDGTPVDGVASNMGHVLGTGLLTEAESAAVATRLTSPDLLGPFGIGTLGRGNPAYNPIGYHTGSVWVHDATICARGLAADGHAEAAGATLRALLEGAMHFDFRLPELYGADPSIGKPAPYPASCRPQAWSAASAVAMVAIGLGIEPDFPRGKVGLRPLRPSPFGALRASGIRVGQHLISVEVDAEGQVVSVEAPGSLDVEVQS